MKRTRAQKHLEKCRKSSRNWWCFAGVHLICVWNQAPLLHIVATTERGTRSVEWHFWQFQKWFPGCCSRNIDFLGHMQKVVRFLECKFKFVNQCSIYIDTVLKDKEGGHSKTAFNITIRKVVIWHIKQHLATIFLCHLHPGCLQRTVKLYLSTPAWNVPLKTKELTFK